jgi:polyphosphate glucokinase
MVQVLGIDVGGSGIKGAPVNVETGELLAERFRLPTPEKGKPDDVAMTIAQISNHYNWHGAIGVGFPAVIRGGMAYTAANVHSSWIGTHAESLFSQATGCPSYVLNDADAAALAEIRFGVGQDYPKGVIILITIGTGLGTAIFVDGKLVPNTELGHIIIRGKDAETRASDAARQAKEMSWKKWSKRFNEYLEHLERLFWPDLFVLGGGVSKDSDKFVPLLNIKTPVEIARLLNQAGIVGAALYGGMRSEQI